MSWYRPPPTTGHYFFFNNANVHSINSPELLLIYHTSKNYDSRKVIILKIFFRKNVSDLHSICTEKVRLKKSDKN